jgi:hypothetical protein
MGEEINGKILREEEIENPESRKKILEALTSNFVKVTKNDRFMVFLSNGDESTLSVMKMSPVETASLLLYIARDLSRALPEGERERYIRSIGSYIFSRGKQLAEDANVNENFKTIINNLYGKEGLDIPRPGAEEAGKENL